MEALILNILQLVIALGLMNVWIFRFRKSTAYRGGDAQNLVEEFAVYGLPKWFCYFVGVLKLGAAFALLAGFVFPAIVPLAGTIIIVLMIGAVAMHMKVKDPIKKALPASAMLLMSVVLTFAALPA